MVRHCQIVLSHLLGAGLSYKDRIHLNQPVHRLIDYAYIRLKLCDMSLLRENLPTISLKYFEGTSAHLLALHFYDTDNTAFLPSLSRGEIF